jgi:hypothetical protein
MDLESPLFLIQNGLTVAACILAIVKGGPAERIGAPIILVNLLAGPMVRALMPGEGAAVGVMLDGLTALALLFVTVRYASLWLGAVMLLYGAQFTLHSFYFVQQKPIDLFYIVTNNINFGLISLSLLVGAVFTWWRNSKARRQAPARARPAA